MATADLRLTFGAMFAGCIISVFLSGIGTLQAYQYLRHYGRKDERPISSTGSCQTSAVCILDFIHTILICQALWFYLVASWGDVQQLDHLIWSVGASIGITGLVTFIVQMFFTVRIWRFSKRNTYLGVIVTVMIVVRLASALATTIQMIRLESFSVFIREFRWLFTAGLALSCVIDLVLTSALCYYLRVNRTGYSTLDETIHRLLMYTISNGLLTTFASMLAMLFAAITRNNFLFISLHFIIAKCYVNSLLATLNSRDALRKRDGSLSGAVHISVDGHSQPRFRRYPHSLNERPIPLSDANNFAGVQRDSVADVKVHVRVEQEVHGDSDGEVDRDASPERSFKTRELAPIGGEGEEDHSVPNVSRFS